MLPGFEEYATSRDRWVTQSVSETDPLTFILVPVIFLVVTLIASAIPARRAATVDPYRAPRAE
jgi:ABC-type lipoprotein release transport system permease subunit